MSGLRPSAAFATDVGGGRRNNEDAALETTVGGPDGPYALWIVADGVGGGPRGELASRTAVESVVEVLSAAGWTDPRAGLVEAFSLANRRVYALGSGEAGEHASVMGSTLVAALVSERTGAATVGNVGDSRAYLVGPDRILQVTEDHSLIAQRVRSGLVDAADARTAPERNVLTRGIGGEPTVTVDTFGPGVLGPGERLVLCSDGLHDPVPDEQIAAIVRASTIEAAPAALVAAALAAGGRDNVTALVGGPAGRTRTRDDGGPR